MLVSEAEWIGNTLLELPDDAFPVLHVGSSSADFRNRQQPWIDQRIFRPLRQNARPTIHVDIKNADGVDVVADVTDPEGITALRRHGAGVVVCANLLEHVHDPQAVLNSVASLVPPLGYLILTCPRRYPLHPDPIDTGFRPGAADLVRMAGPSFSPLLSRELTCRRIFFYFAEGRPGRLALRMLMPIYRPRNWLHLARWVWRRPVQSVALLQRNTAPN
jgi:SAM-dependent methyltransferase